MMIRMINKIKEVMYKHLNESKENTNKQLNTREYYSAIKKNEIMSFAEKWMELEINMLSKTKQLKKPYITCSCFFVDPKPKMMMTIIMGHEWETI
jgi:hypothetical protein